MKYKSAWEGDWQARIHQRLKEKGYESLISFAERNPKATFIQLAKMLGEQVAAIQVEQLLAEAYFEQDQYPRYMRSALARHIRQWVSDGWKTTENFDFTRSSAFTDWEMRTPDEYNDFNDRVREIFKYATNIPKGWLPSGADDPIIIDAFEKAGFKELELAAA